jgi:hypothetical protein
MAELGSRLILVTLVENLIVFKYSIDSGTERLLSPPD